MIRGQNRDEYKGDTMEYPDLYRTFLRQQTAETLVALLQQQKQWENPPMTRLSIVAAEPLPYVHIALSDSHFPAEPIAACMRGMILDKEVLGDLRHECAGRWFYLPALCKPEELDRPAQANQSDDLAVEHEVLHIIDMIRWIHEEPDYPERILKWGIDRCTEGNIAQSIDIEVEKICRLEPRAMGNDFDKGENLILQLFLGTILTYKCRTRAEFIEIRMAGYIET